MADHTTLYRLFDAAGRLLYVGIASNPGRRFEQHRGSKTWWGDVARTELAHYDSRGEAAAAELQAITVECPLHNIRGSTVILKEVPMSSDRRQRADRLTPIDRRPLAPDSLVGSYFHSDAGRGWQGCIVAEPRPGLYLVELFGWLVGDSLDQQLVSVEEMAGWRFYDTAEWMNNAYEHGVAGRWERQRETVSRAEGASNGQN